MSANEKRRAARTTASFSSFPTRRSCARRLDNIHHDPAALIGSKNNKTTSFLVGCFVVVLAVSFLLPPPPLSLISTPAAGTSMLLLSSSSSSSASATAWLLPSSRLLVAARRCSSPRSTAPSSPRASAARLLLDGLPVLDRVDHRPGLLQHLRPCHVPERRVRVRLAALRRPAVRGRAPPSLSASPLRLTRDTPSAARQTEAPTAARRHGPVVSV